MSESNRPREEEDIREGDKSREETTVMSSRRRLLDESAKTTGSVHAISILLDHLKCPEGIQRSIVLSIFTRLTKSEGRGVGEVIEEINKLGVVEFIKLNGGNSTTNESTPENDSFVPRDTGSRTRPLSGSAVTEDMISRVNEELQAASSPSPTPLLRTPSSSTFRAITPEQIAADIASRNSENAETTPVRTRTAEEMRIRQTTRGMPRPILPIVPEVRSEIPTPKQARPNSASAAFSKVGEIFRKIAGREPSEE